MQAAAWELNSPRAVLGAGDTSLREASAICSCLSAPMAQHSLGTPISAVPTVAAPSLRSFLRDPSSAQAFSLLGEAGKGGRCSGTSLGISSIPLWQLGGSAGLL